MSTETEQAALIAGQLRTDGTEVTPAEVRATSGATSVTITVEFGADLSEREVWPDGDAPPRWNARDVAALIARDCISASDFISDWSLGTFATVDVRDNIGNHVSVEYPGAEVRGA